MLYTEDLKNSYEKSYSLFLLIFTTFNYFLTLDISKESLIKFY